MLWCASKLWKKVRSQQMLLDTMRNPPPQKMVIIREKYVLRCYASFCRKCWFVRPTTFLHIWRKKKSCVYRWCCTSPTPPIRFQLSHNARWRVCPSPSKLSHHTAPVISTGTISNLTREMIQSTRDDVHGEFCTDAIGIEIEQCPAFRRPCWRSWSEVDAAGRRLGWRLSPKLFAQTRCTRNSELLAP